MTRRARHAALALVLALAAAAGCAVNPATGRREFSTMSPEREAQIGREASQQVAQEMGLVDSPALAAYVEAIGQRVAQAAPRPDVRFQFHVVDMPEPNAFALPGGYVYVSRGLLALANDEDELANVIGHEIGHVAARHAAQRETRAMGVGIATLLGTVAGALLGVPGAALSQLGQVAGAGLIASYSRDQEREADRLGQQYASASGYDPGAMSTFLRSLEAETRLEPGGNRRPSFLDSHPATPERVDATARDAQGLAFTPGQPIAPSRDAFLEKLDGLAVGENAAEGVFRRETFLHPGLGFRVRFPDGWQVQNGKSAVGARSPEGDALVVLEGQEQGNDAQRAAARFLQRQPMRVLDDEPFRAGDGQAHRVVAVAETQQGQVGVHLAFIPHGGVVYRMTGASAPESFRAREPLFLAAARSFRTLTREELQGIGQKRLRLVRARANESLADLAARSGDAWRIEETAVANALDPGSRLEAGRLVKIAREEALDAGSGAR